MSARFLPWELLARRTRIRPEVVMVDIVNDQDVVPFTGWNTAAAPIIGSWWTKAHSATTAP